MSFQIHTLETAPEKSVELLEQAKAKFGFIPNLFGVFAESPEITEAYLVLADLIDRTSFSPLERQIVYIAASVSNDCHYCVAAHTTVSSMQKLPDDVIAAVREAKPLTDVKLEALRQFTLAVNEKRGFVSEADTKAFLDAGYTKQNILEVILVLGTKVITNYTNHINVTPLDAAFEPAKWREAHA